MDRMILAQRNAWPIRETIEFLEQLPSAQAVSFAIAHHEGKSACPVG